MSFDWSVLVAISVSILSLTISLYDVFGDKIEAKLLGEYLKLDHDGSVLLCQPTQHDDFEEGFKDCVVVRLNVFNTGGKAAKNVRLFLTAHEVFEEQAQSFRLEKSFCPIHLTWLHYGSQVELPIIPPYSRYLADLGILLPSGVTPKCFNRSYQPNRFPSDQATFQLFTQKYPMNNASFLEPGRHRFQYELLTDGGLRGAGNIELEFNRVFSSEVDPSRLVHVTVKRSFRVGGKRIFQRKL